MIKKQKLTAKQKKWIQLLESGKYRRTESVLFDGKCYCCLGVAARHVCKTPYVRIKNTFETLYKFNDIEDVLAYVDYKTMGLFSAGGEIELSLRSQAYDILRSVGYSKIQQQDTLADYNDAGATFKQIAYLLKTLPEAVFVKP